VLNATTINTGHNWQFTASWMGEPPGNILADIDVNGCGIIDLSPGGFKIGSPVTNSVVKIYLFKLVMQHK